MKRFLLYVFTVGISFTISAQQRDAAAFQQQYQFHIAKTTVPVKIDGVLNDAVWATTPKTDSFFLKFPNDLGRPKLTTDVQVTYDDQFIYFAFTAHDSGKAFIQTLKRDNGHDGNDCVAIILDPTNQRTNGFFFVLNAYNAQSEDQLPLGEDNNNQWSWDNKWFSATRRYADRWTAEIAIPFKTLRYTSDKLLWGLNFLRVDTKRNEYSVWTHVPVNFRSHSLAYTGSLIWNTPPPPAGSNAVFLPYITGGINGDKENATGTKAYGNAGFDAKLALSSALNLDITANPDFSQIEVDQQVTNLTRFNIFFPERRTFFLENANLFSEFGTPDARPFYSRTIGLDNNGNKIPIVAGLRLSGNLNKSTRIGLVNIQTAKKGAVAAQNYTAATIHQRVLKRSVIKAYFLDRENFISKAEKKQHPLDAFGRNAGIEFNYNNEKSTVEGWASYNHSFKEGITSDNGFINTGIKYNGRNVTGLAALGTLGTNYYTDMGFVSRIENYDAARDTVIRLGYKDMLAQVGYNLYTKKGFATQHNIELSNYTVFNPNNTLNEQNTELNYFALLKNTGTLFGNLSHNRVHLLFPISFTGGTPLPKANYAYNQLRIGYNSDFRKTVSFEGNIGLGGFYNGTFQSLSGGINIRKQPHVNIGLNAAYNKLSFPAAYGNTELFLIRSRIEINFSTSLFWTTFLQYNTQRNNFNINSRLQYRYKPMSDFFLVYTDNYFTDPLFKNKNRAVVFKMNYWLNL
jgi:Domain of unknown function (DUF5916)/Carbohydrate family 9 binding domain-like